MTTTPSHPYRRAFRAERRLRVFWAAAAGVLYSPLPRGGELMAAEEHEQQQQQEQPSRSAAAAGAAAGATAASSQDKRFAFTRAAMVERKEFELFGKLVTLYSEAARTLWEERKWPAGLTPETVLPSALSDNERKFYASWLRFLLRQVIKESCFEEYVQARFPLYTEKETSSKLNTPMQVLKHQNALIARVLTPPLGQSHVDYSSDVSQLAAAAGPLVLAANTAKCLEATTGGVGCLSVSYLYGLLHALCEIVLFAPRAPADNRHPAAVAAFNELLRQVEWVVQVYTYLGSKVVPPWNLLELCSLVHSGGSCSLRRSVSLSEMPRRRSSSRPEQTLTPLEEQPEMRAEKGRGRVAPLARHSAQLPSPATRSPRLIRQSLGVMRMSYETQV